MAATGAMGPESGSGMESSKTEVMVQSSVSGCAPVSLLAAAVVFDLPHPDGVEDEDLRAEEIRGAYGRGRFRNLFELRSLRRLLDMFLPSYCMTLAMPEERVKKKRCTCRMLPGLCGFVSCLTVELRNV